MLIAKREALGFEFGLSGWGLDFGFLVGFRFGYEFLKYIGIRFQIFGF